MKSDLQTIKEYCQRAMDHESLSEAGKFYNMAMGHVIDMIELKQSFTEKEMKELNEQTRWKK